MTDTTSFTRAFTASRARVLTRNADPDEQSATQMRRQKARFPEQADAIEADAAACDVYAAECRAAADDSSLPTPSGPNYPNLEG